MSSQPPDVGPFLRKARVDRNLTLDQVAQSSKVSKSMLSQVERGEANPTFAVLWAITQALGIDIADIAQAGTAVVPTHAIDVTTAFSTPVMRSTDGACALRILSPPQTAGVTEWYDVQIEPGGALNSAAHAHGSMEHLTVLSGELEIVVEQDKRRIGPGETARYPVDRAHRISNSGKDQAHALMVLIYEKDKIR